MWLDGAERWRVSFIEPCDRLLEGKEEREGLRLVALVDVLPEFVLVRKGKTEAIAPACSTVRTHDHCVSRFGYILRSLLPLVAALSHASSLQ